MKGSGGHRDRWIFLLLAAMGAVLFLLGGLLGNREKRDADYAEYLEARVRELCLSIDGVEAAEVFLTLNEETAVETGVFGEAKTAAVPTVRGIAVVCAGGERAPVRETVTRLLSAALGIPSSRISVAGKSG